MRSLFIDVKNAAHLWYEKDADHLAATASYYALFAVAPMLLLSISYLSVMYGRTTVMSNLHDWGMMLGPDMLVLLSSAINNLTQLSDSVGVPFFGIFFFSGMIIILFNTMASGLHKLWDIPHQGIRGWFNKSLRSVVFTFVFQVYLVGVLAFQLFTEWLSGAANVLGWAMNSVFFVVVTTLFFSLAYKILPRVTPPLKNRLYGAFVASILMAVVKSGVAAYLTFTPVPGLYEAAGVMISLLLWLYATGCVFYFGAALAKMSVR